MEKILLKVLSLLPAKSEVVEKCIHSSYAVVSWTREGNCYVAQVFNDYSGHLEIGLNQTFDSNGCINVDSDIEFEDFGGLLTGRSKETEVETTAVTHTIHKSDGSVLESYTYDSWKDLTLSLYGEHNLSVNEDDLSEEGYKDLYNSEFVGLTFFDGSYYSTT